MVTKKEKNFFAEFYNSQIDKKIQRARLYVSVFTVMMVVSLILSFIYGHLGDYFGMVYYCVCTFGSMIMTGILAMHGDVLECQKRKD